MTTPFVSASLPWLVRLRWLTLGAQIAAAVIAQEVVRTPVVWWLVLGLVSVAVGSNVWLTYAARSRPADEVRGTRVMGWVLIQDTVMLTGILLASGASANPFTVLYLVYIVLAALVLDARWTGWVTLLSAVGFGSLFLMPAPESADMHHHDHGHGYSEHLVGMWIAFAMTAAIVAYFVRTISITLEGQRLQISDLREKAATARHLASLTTLAAGAAHELRTPLATIALAAHELGATWRRFALPEADHARGVADVELIEAEVERCQEILWAMRPGFDEDASFPESTSVEDVMNSAVAAFEERASNVVLKLEASPSTLTLQLAKAHAVRAISQLLDNAIDASNGGTVMLGARVIGDRVVLSVTDEGAGMDAETLERATAPFFTTKGPGQGMGLGLFLAQAFAHSVGGELRLSSTVGVGSRAELILPFSPGDATEAPS